MRLVVFESFALRRRPSFFGLRQLRIQAFGFAIMKQLVYIDAHTRRRSDL
jgi:hypothetical protein